MKALTESEREEVRLAIKWIDHIVEPPNNGHGYNWFTIVLLKNVRPILDYAKEPQNFPDAFIEQ